MIEELARLTKRVLDIVKHEATCRQLMTTPGIGPIPVGLRGPTSPQGHSPIAPPSTGRNASNARAMWARISASRHDWPGGQSSDLRRRRGQQAAEGRYQSGETDITGRISRQIGEGGGDELGRTGPHRRIRVEAAHTLLVRSSQWSALREL